MMLMNYIRKVDRINIVMILAYGTIIILAMFYAGFEKIFILILDLVVSIPILLFMNHFMKQEPIFHRSPYYYFVFLTLVTITVFLDGAYNSFLFPLIFFLPALYVSVNFSRKGSSGVAIFAVTIIWLILMQDPLHQKLENVVLVSLSILALPQIIGYLIKEYINHMKKLIKMSKIPIEDEKMIG